MAGIAADFSSDPGEEILISSKDTDHQHGFHVGEKWWMIQEGYLPHPTVGNNDFGRSFSNPIADEPLLNVAVGGSVSGVIDTTGDTDDVQVFLVAGQTYHVSLRGTGATPLNDSFLQVFNPSAALVGYDDDGGNGLYSMMTFTAAETGNHIIRAASFSNPGDPGTGGYTVDVRVQGADAVGDTNGTSVLINVGQAVFGFRETATVSGGNDLDRYAIQLEAGKFYTFKVAAGADYETDYTAVPFGEIDTILRLRNAAGTLLASNDDVSFPSDISSALGFLAETSGTYYLDVTGYAGQTGGYLLESEEIDPAGEDPLQAIRWVSADNIDTIDVNGTPTAYVYFGLQGENFGQSNFGASWGWNAKEKAAVMSALLEYTKIT
ncbi:MAG: PPC domain-containing protein, partial [Sphingomonas sp.]